MPQMLIIRIIIELYPQEKYRSQEFEIRIKYLNILYINLPSTDEGKESITCNYQFSPQVAL